MVNKSGIIFLSIIVFAGSFFGFKDSYYIDGNIGWEQAREPGSSLDGYWYIPKMSDGCFEGGAVMLLKNKKYYIINGPDITLTNSIIKKNKDSVFISIQESRDTWLNSYNHDQGQALLIKKVVALTNNKSEDIIDNSINQVFLKTCDNPTSKGMIKSLFVKIFKPLPTDYKLPQNPSEMFH